MQSIYLFRNAATYGDLAVELLEAARTVSVTHKAFKLRKPELGAAVLYIGPFALLTLAAAINLKIWTGHLIKIGDTVLATKPYERLMRVRPRVVTFVTAAYCAATVSSVITLTMLQGEGHETTSGGESIDTLSLAIFGLSSCFIGLCFLAVGVVIMVRLRSYFYNFYDEFSCKLWASIFALSLPLMLRGSMDVARFYKDDWDKTIVEEKAGHFYHILFYILLDFAPVLLQLSSLIFGYIRSQRGDQQGALGAS